jgi:ATP-dependent RNA helicase RhlE
VLVATDIAARGIDVDALGHVVNFDLPAATEDYIHRVGRTARGTDATGDAITLVSPEEEGDLSRIERTLGSKLPRVRLDGFAYDAAPEERLEVPRGQRIAAIQARKAAERANASKKSDHRAKDDSASASSRPRRRRFRRGRRG